MSPLFSFKTIKENNTAILFGCLLIVIGISRHLPIDYPNLLNFSPVLAIFLVGGAYLRGRFTWIIPLIAVIVSDLTLNPGYGVGLFEPFMIITLSSYLLIFFFGRTMGNKCSISKIFGAGIFSALFFHIATCTFAWVVNPFYLKSLSGWWQAIFIGEYGYAPSYLFLRNSILSTSFFSVFLAIFARLIDKKKSTEVASVNQKAILKQN